MSRRAGALGGLALLQVACSDARPAERWHAELAGRRVRNSAVDSEGSVILWGDRPELERVVGGTAWVAKVDANGAFQWEVVVEDLRQFTRAVVGADGIIRATGAPDDGSGWAAPYPTVAIAFDSDGHELYRVDGHDHPYDQAQHVFADGTMVTREYGEFVRASPEGDRKWVLNLGSVSGSYVDLGGTSFGVNGKIRRPSDSDPKGSTPKSAAWYVDALDWKIRRIVVDDLTPWEAPLTAGSLVMAEDSIVAKRTERRGDGGSELRLVRFDASGALLWERTANLGALRTSGIGTNNAGEVVVVADGGGCGVRDDQSWVAILDPSGVWIDAALLARIDHDPVPRWQGHSGVHTVDAHLRDDTLYLVGVQDAMFTWVRRIDL